MPTSYTPPGGSAEGATFDLDHRVSVATRGDGRSVAISYDSEDRVANITIERGEYAFTWDPVNAQLESVTAPDGGVLTFSYRGSLLESARWSGGEVNGTVAWTYDNDQRLASETVSCPTVSGPSCDTVDYEYDSDDLLIRAGGLLLYHHPPNGTLLGATLNQLGDAYTYNEYGEVERYEAFFIDQPVFTQELTRDGAGRIITSIETIDGAASTYEYGYDSARRLSSVKKNGVQTASYTYDGNGNRLTRTTQSGTAIGTYDSEDRVQTYAGATCVHTPAGDLQNVTDTSGTTTYSYDEFGSLTRVVLPNGDVIEYVIDGRNRRIAKKLNGVVEQRWLYRNAMQIAAELDANGEVSRRFVYGTRVNVPDVMITPSGTFRIVSDHLGSVRVVVDAVTGAIAQRIDYDVLGNVLVDTNPGFQPFGFAGGIYDRGTALVRFGARDYDSRLGRFTNRDPILFAGRDTNLYAYTWNDPINWIDPEGLDGRATAAAALSEVGSDEYGYADPHPESRGRATSVLGGRKSNKCNAFVWDMLKAGGDPPGRLAGGRIPSADEWADPYTRIRGYYILPSGSKLKAGDVVATGGHVGLFMPLPGGAPGTVSAAAGLLGEVVHNDWGFRIGRCRRFVAADATVPHETASAAHRCTLDRRARWLQGYGGSICQQDSRPTVLRIRCARVACVDH